MAFSYPYFLTLQIYENIISFLMNYYTSEFAHLLHLGKPKCFIEIAKIE